MNADHINTYLAKAREIIGDRSQDEIEYDNAVVAHLGTGVDIKHAIRAANLKYPKKSLKPNSDHWTDLAERYDYLKEHKAILERLGMEE
jgi:hypothetical protein